jgi:hypothetical protein
MKTNKIFYAILFFSFFLSISNALAYCSMPAVYRESGAGMNLVGLGSTTNEIEIKQSDYPIGSSWINYNLQIKNKDSTKSLLVYLQSESSQNNVHTGSIILAPNEKANLALTVWVRQSTISDLVFILNGTCDDGSTFAHSNPPKLKIKITSGEDVPPQNGCTLPIAKCDMNTGLFTTYVCEDSVAVPKYFCVKSCCEAFGQQVDDDSAFCSNDKHTCISTLNLPPATEGNIAFLCNKDDCKYEKDIILTLRLLGWNVDGKSYKNWLESDFNNYDIIACYHQSACKLAFNSPAYNAHVTNKKPFLEIAMSRSASAAYAFGYTTKTTSYSGKNMFFVTAEDELTNGFSTFVDVVSKSKPMFAVVSDEYLDTANNPELKDLADSGYNLDKKQGSIFFKVAETVDHGNYAFIGWLTGLKRGELNVDGETILKRTLNWLKSTNLIGDRKEIAFLCSKDTCSDKDEMDLIKMFRSWGFLVVGKSLNSWVDEINNFDLIVCRNSKSSCKISLMSSVYNAYVTNNIPFLEIPETSKAYAAEIFGYVLASSKFKRTTSTSIEAVSSDPIVSGLGNPINIFDKKRPIVGIYTDYLNSVNDIAHIVGQPASTLFTAQSSGKYAFIGWLGRSNIKYMNGNATEILHRTINWLAS